MKSSDRAILVGIAVIGLIAALWFVLLAPKRQEAASLGDDVAQLRDSVAQQEQAAATGEQAKHDFASNYHELVVLGQAVPAEDDTASLIAQLSALSSRSKIDFRDLVLEDSSMAAPAPTTPAPVEPAPSEEEATGAEQTQTDTAIAAAAAPATEAAAAGLPLGASIGPAGLPLMPYSLKFRGGFFHVGDFFDELDDMVHTRGGEVDVDGRLLTIDGFNFSADPRLGFPNLLAELAVTSYTAPDEQGALAGATPTAPAPTTPAPATSETAPTDTSTATSTSTPTAP